MFIRKISITIFSLLLLSAMATGTVSAKTNTKTINYVALGDSLAEGQTPTELGAAGDYDTSYADIIKDRLAEEGDVNYNNYGMSGYTTADIFTNLVTYGSAISNAEIITLNIGANDLFYYLEAEEGDVTQLLGDLANMNDGQIAELISQINVLESNVIPYVVYPKVVAIVTEIKRLNPDAKIYVMGYYNAFSFLEEYSDDPILQRKINTLLPELTGLIEAYNGALQNSSSRCHLC